MVERPLVCYNNLKDGDGMKRSFIFLPILFLMMNLSACGNSPSADQDMPKAQMVAVADNNSQDVLMKSEQKPKNQEPDPEMVQRRRAEMRRMLENGEEGCSECQNGHCNFPEACPNLENCTDGQCQKHGKVNCPDCAGGQKGRQVGPQIRVQKTGSEPA